MVWQDEPDKKDVNNPVAADEVEDEEMDEADDVELPEIDDEGFEDERGKSSALTTNII